MNVQEITSIKEIDTFIQNNRMSMLYVSQENCNVCHAIYPKLKELVSQYPEIKLAHIDARKVKEVAGKFLIFTVPTIMLFQGQQEYLREDRFVQFAQLELGLQQLYNAMYPTD
ncbi:thioredoxin family protein [Paenibacillus taichungensis]|uniref:Thioredoxin family protein n=1 Tax=Paenibacillus taichungensis TaxID=484184 RepID=A0ABX2MSB3_9BACL|nr:thioredoxin family protein [Paenibacillus taichungensis]NUU56930.1 thioredoxin family protein [Paenibacillus taichungensis]